MGNFCELVENKIFMEKTFAGCSLVPPKQDAMPPNFAEKTFPNSRYTNFMKVFLLESFPLYSISVHTKMHMMNSITCEKEDSSIFHKWLSTVLVIRIQSGSEPESFEFWSDLPWGNWALTLEQRVDISALFPGLPQLQFWIACSMQKLSYKWSKPEPGKAWEWGGRALLASYWLHE